MELPIVTVDAFADAPFTGNPAAVCVLESWLADDVLARIAAEMNLSETAFLVRRPDGAFDLRWLTPAIEVDLCGHATLASAHHLYSTGLASKDSVLRFHTRSGALTARLVPGGAIELDFPATPARAEDAPPGLAEALGVRAIHAARKSPFDWLVEVGTEAEVRAIAPDMTQLRTLPVRGVIVTARADADDLDFVSRFFGPGAGVDEDPVTGSAHCALAPYWAEKLGKRTLSAYQASRRGGRVECVVTGDRVLLRGRAITMLRGSLTVG